MSIVPSNTDVPNSTLLRCSLKGYLREIGLMCFKQSFIAVLDEVAPMRETRIKNRSACWMSSEIVDLIRQRNRCFIKSKLPADYNSHVNLRNQVSASDKYGKSFVNSFYRNKIVSVDAFAISPVSEDKVRASLSTLSVNKATGLDLIPSRFLRDSAEVTCSILTHVINLSISQGVFPNEMKSARVVSFFKKK